MEISLAKGLNGREALDSMLYELRKKLAMNGRFGTNMNYPGYRAVLKVEFYPAASFVPPVIQTVEAEKLKRDLTVSETATVTEEVTIPVRPPNEVREGADMPTPVLSQDQYGNPVEKWVKNAPKPKNKVVGGRVGPEPAVTMTPTVIVSAPPVAKQGEEGLNMAGKG